MITLAKEKPLDHFFRDLNLDLDFAKVYNMRLDHLIVFPLQECG